VTSQKTVAALPIGQKSNKISLDKVFTEHDQALAEHQGNAAVRTTEITTQSLPPEMQRVVQVLCDTYEAIDLRIETTLGAAEADFLAAMPEVKGHETDLRQLVKLLISDVRDTAGAVTSVQPLLLRFAYQDRGDLVEQLLSGAKARLVVVPAEDDVSLHVNIKGFHK